ncbi:MAG: peptidase S41, partial [Thermoplasmata archaeon]
MSSYYTSPDIKDDNVLFVGDDDLWEMSLKDRKPRRITSSIGIVTDAKYSPDGKNIAFRVMSGQSASSADIYLYERKNGSVRRLTYLSGKSTSRRMFTDIAGWTPDGRLVISTSALFPFSTPDLFYADLETGNLYPLDLGPATHIIYVGSKIIIGRNTYELPHWKGYKGGTRGKLWAGDLKSGFKKFLELDTSISSPVLVGSRIYFITDTDGTGQIYSVDLNGSDLKRHTDFKEFYPRNLKSDGVRIV